MSEDSKRWFLQDPTRIDLDEDEVKKIKEVTPFPIFESLEEATKFLSLYVQEKVTIISDGEPDKRSFRSSHLYWIGFDVYNISEVSSDLLEALNSLILRWLKLTSRGSYILRKIKREVGID